MNKTLSKNDSKLPRRTYMQGVALTQAWLNNLQGRSETKQEERLDGLRRRLPTYASPLPHRLPTALGMRQDGPNRD